MAISDSAEIVEEFTNSRASGDGQASSSQFLLPKTSLFQNVNTSRSHTIHPHETLVLADSQSGSNRAGSSPSDCKNSFEYIVFSPFVITVITHKS